MQITQRWIVHRGHGTVPWESALRRELIAAYRRGTMNAERCLGTYRLQGSREILPPEAVIYLASRVAVERDIAPAQEVTREALSDHGGDELAALYDLDREGFEDLVEAGRRFFFPSPLGDG